MTKEVAQPSGLPVGPNKGHIVTKRAVPKRPVDRKGILNKRVKFVREVVREVTGFAPYEKRLIEMLRIGKDRRALRFAKKRLGTHLRAKKKREEMSVALRATRK
eukprot:TRINITY_DN1584_c0_g1::TRINITY_DN1584_c0_g1_i1::g.28150::m.28150 TRINITY_DN1584_c0_g1::TRINITY_DN1584_c0_g1_i1::g.28150  ORF type:complete len:116 (-),score=25.96,sp/Q9LZ57/RL363_ARATH/60.64/1e-32,Ribosomal_L36e/PF01158.13/5e-39 TRINITY_DN1584_c0_g1_i1:155-466(-)